MRQPKTFLLLSVVVAILFMAVAYAAIQNITLTVSGNTVATPDQGNFDVKFGFVAVKEYQGQPIVKVKDNNIVGSYNGQIIDNTGFGMEVSGLTTKGDYVTIVAPIVNNGEIDALLSYSVECSNTEYFKVTLLEKPTEIGKKYRGDIVTAEFSFKIELTKTPIVEQTGDFSIRMTAEPTQFNS